MPRMSPEEVEKRVFEVETIRNVSKSDHPSLAALSPKKYLFVLLWTDSDTIIQNKTEWAREQGLSRTEVYIYLGDEKVVQAIRYLDSTIHSASSSQVLKVVEQQALKGCTKSQKLYLDRFRPIDGAPTSPEERPSLDWDTTLAKPVETQGDSPIPQSN